MLFPLLHIGSHEKLVRPQLPVRLPSTWTLGALDEAERKGLREFPFLCYELAA